MVVHVYSNMYNEEKMLPFFLRHYETIADRIFVWDDDSTDNTRNLLVNHPKVTILPMEKHGVDDVYWINYLYPQYKEFSRGKADWVIVADADEFIYHPNLLQVLKNEKDRGTQLIHCRGFAMTANNFPTTNKQIYDEIKYGLPDWMESKWTVHSPNIEIVYKKGRHDRPHVNSGVIRNRESGIKLLHYRYLGDKYFEDRDRIITERNKIVYPNARSYSPNNKRTCPDASRGSVLNWYHLHKAEAVNVVDNN